MHAACSRCGETTTPTTTNTPAKMQHWTSFNSFSFRFRVFVHLDSVKKADAKPITTRNQHRISAKIAVLWMKSRLEWIECSGSDDCRLSQCRTTWNMAVKISFYLLHRDRCWRQRKRDWERWRERGKTVLWMRTMLCDCYWSGAWAPAIIS